MWTPEALAFVSSQRVGHLATVDPSGTPQVVPICFAFDGSHFFSVIDEKPKRVKPGALRRVRNIGEGAPVSLVVDRYSEDWTRLGFVLITGRAEVRWDGAQRDRGVALLREKYPQYGEMQLEGRPAIVVTPERVTVWGWLGGASRPSE